MKVSFLPRPDGKYVATKAASELDIDNTEGFEEYEFPIITIIFPVADKFTPEQRESTYQSLLKHEQPKLFERQVMDLLERNGPQMFHDMLEAAQMTSETIDAETVQHMYVSALMSGAQVGIRAVFKSIRERSAPSQPEPPEPPASPIIIL